MFDRIIEFYDARRMDVNGSAPFRNDPLKLEFHLAMMRCPNLLHVTVMTVGNQIASAHLGVCGRGEVQLGLIAHNPEFEKHSPGKFHILFLARMLMQEGYRQLDLTAGGDPYKERFANAHDDVHTLRVFPSGFGRTTAAIAAGLEKPARKTLDLLHVSPARARRFVNSLKKLNPAAIPAWLGRRAARLRASRPIAPLKPDSPDTTPPACVP